MAKIKGAIVVDTERCKGCNLCVVACPLDVIALNKEVNMKGTVHPDTGGSQLHGKRAGQGDDARLGAGVGHLAACAPLAPDG